LGWNSELHALYNEMNIIQDFKLKRLRSAGHQHRTGKGRITETVVGAKL
jgi:hypothetical protein